MFGDHARPFYRPASVLKLGKPRVVFVILRTMKKTVVPLIVLLLVALAAIWYLKFAGVTHEDIHAAVTDESEKIRSVVDDRCQKLDKKLDRIEGKLDKLLEIANRPLPDGMKRAE